MNYLGCMIPEPFGPNSDKDQDGILNLDEDINGDGILENDDSNGNKIPDYLDPLALTTDDFSENSIHLFPNPATSSISIIGADENSQLSIFDLNGRKLKQIRNVSGIEVSDLSSGIYLIQIQSDTKSRTIRFVKQ